MNRNPPIRGQLSICFPVRIVVWKSCFKLHKPIAIRPCRYPMYPDHIPGSTHRMVTDSSTDHPLSLLSLSRTSSVKRFCKTPSLFPSTFSFKVRMLISGVYHRLLCGMENSNNGKRPTVVSDLGRG